MSDEPSVEARTYGSLPMPLQEGEVVLELVHRHWWYLWPRTILWVLFAVVPVIVLALVFDEIGILDDLGIFFWIVAALWLGWWLVRLALNWYRYANDIWLVTNQRIIDSFKSNPFNHRLSTADLVNVQDISVEKIGLAATVLSFGDVVCQTAAGGVHEPFRIIGIARPKAIQLLIDKERDRERQRLGAGPGTAASTV
jgi:hypothetical protein